MSRWLAVGIFVLGVAAAGPVAAQAGREAALQQVGVPSTVNPPPPVLVTASTPTLPSPSLPVPSLLPAVTPVGGMTIMPDVTRLSARDAVRVLTNIGLTVRPHGSGIVVKQTPAPGEFIDPGSWSLLELQRTTAADPRGPR